MHPKALKVGSLNIIEGELTERELRAKISSDFIGSILYHLYT